MVISPALKNPKKQSVLAAHSMIQSKFVGSSFQTALIFRRLGGVIGSRILPAPLFLD